MLAAPLGSTKKENDQLPQSPPPLPMAEDPARQSIRKSHNAEVGLRINWWLVGSKAWRKTTTPPASNGLTNILLLPQLAKIGATIAAEDMTRDWRKGPHG
jgi:hypothetical protein